MSVWLDLLEHICAFVMRADAKIRCPTSVSRTVATMPFSPKRLGSVVLSMALFAIVSVLAGVLIAGLFVPVAGLAGLSSKAAATELDNLPAELSTPTPPTRSKVLMANGKVLAYFYDENRIPVPMSR